MNHEIDEKESLISELSERITNGLFKENPTFVLLLGMCPTLAVTTSGINGLGMGVTTMMVLAMSNLFISLLRKVIPNKIRIPAFIVIIASFVTIVELLLHAYIHSLYKNLGIYIPLIVVNCIILGRAEAYAYSHGPLLSLFDGIGMGMGFTIALTIIGSVRELLGAGTVFGANIMPKGYVPVSIFIMAPGAFFILAILTAIQNKVKEIGERHGKDMSKIQSGCGGNCMSCDKECKVSLAEPAFVADKEEDIPEDEVTKEPKPLVNESVEEPSIEATSSDDEKPLSTEPDTAPEESTVEENTVEEPAVEVKKPEEEKTVAIEPEKEPEEASDETKSEEPVAQASEAAEPVTEESIAKPEKAETEEPAKNEEPEAEKPASDDDLELLDFSDYKKAIKKTTQSGKKPVRKRSSMEKAQAMLNKADKDKGGSEE